MVFDRGEGGAGAAHVGASPLPGTLFSFFFFVITLDAGSGWPLSLELSDTQVYAR